MVERLESRRLFAATAVVVKGVLRVRGDLIASNAITVDETTSGGATAVSVTVVYVDRLGNTKTLQSSFPTTGINEVFIRGGYSGDTIKVGQNSTPAFAINTRIDGLYSLSGTDSITTAGENDTINGGFASDNISSGDGNDVIHGGWLFDHIIVGNGNDKIRGGVMADTIVAGNGNDTIVGGHRNDSIIAGNGNDLINGFTGDDTILAGNGADSIWGWAGNDSITAGNGNDLLGGIDGRNTLIGGSGADTYYERKGKKPNDLTPTYDPAKGDQIVTTGHEAAVPKV